MSSERNRPLFVKAKNGMTAIQFLQDRLRAEISSKGERFIAASPVD
jgi:hypothetical protein